jgi:serine phosphatase RsbU (regulator of sigma subunit)/anti-sigma regulatory factor (Ser/Thr protein kinase)/PAS domain-containing protein
MDRIRGRRPADRVSDDPERSARNRPARGGGRLRDRRGRWFLGGRSVAGQVFVLQAVIVLLLVAAADFIVVTNTHGIRYTHPNPKRIGHKFIGTIGPPLAGRPITQTVNGTLGRLVQAVVPVRGPGGRVVGLVSAGVTINKISGDTDRQLPFLVSAACIALALSTAGTALVSRRLRRQTRGLGPVEMTRMYEHHNAVLHAVREGVLIVGGDGSLLLVNDEARRLLRLPADVEGRPVDAVGLPARVGDLLASRTPATDEMLSVDDRVLVVNVRATDRDGGPPGTVATLRDATELRSLSGRAEQARARLSLLRDATTAIGTTLDVRRTARELAEAATPRFADFVTVDLAQGVTDGEEPPTALDMNVTRVAVGGSPGTAAFYPLGATTLYGAGTPPGRSLATGRPQLVARLDARNAEQANDVERAREILRTGFHSLITVPLRARGVMLGIATFWRSGLPDAFNEDDLPLAEELGGHAALCIDNARRYTREHTMAVSLQHSLLPRGFPAQDGLDVAYRYLPAKAGVGGDWFDVIPLSGARVALVVGDVVGHGLHAAATMGRLRTAVHNFSALDLPPDELLGHLDELVNRVDQEAADEGPDGVSGATCLYAIYDPATGVCVMSRAGHPPPALLRPDGTVQYPDVPAGPPLGVAMLPYETTELTLEPGSQLVLYTDGLVESRDRDIDEGLERLAAVLRGTTRTPEEHCRAVLDALLPVQQRDDIALLVARTRTLSPDHIALWDVPPEPEAVAGVRHSVTRQLDTWGLQELAFTTELILSELITNAIRYAGGDIKVRLLLDRNLICEVSDTGNTSPHLRYAAGMDEGGRGLFLVAQLADRWGTRHTPTGKIIWTEQALS